MGKSDHRTYTWTGQWKHPHVRGEEIQLLSHAITVLETPPRAWGREHALIVVVGLVGNTPTCVGKSRTRTTPALNLWKHPHVRGEEYQKSISGDCRAETPPRAWGRVCPEGAAQGSRGNTPTCVGKTIPFSIAFLDMEKHPHGRGEDASSNSRYPANSETPPRAWGRPITIIKASHIFGNTPTGVGKTAHSKFKWLRYYNTFFPFVKEPGSVCADFSIISCSPDMDVKSFVGMPFA